MKLDEFLTRWKCPQGCAQSEAEDRGDTIIVTICHCFWHLWPSVLGFCVIEAEKPVKLETRS